jgi:hypothetical protein
MSNDNSIDIMDSVRRPRHFEAKRTGSVSFIEVRNKVMDATLLVPTCRVSSKHWNLLVK